MKKSQISSVGNRVSELYQHMERHSLIAKNQPILIDARDLARIANRMSLRELFVGRLADYLLESHSLVLFEVSINLYGLIPFETVMKWRKVPERFADKLSIYTRSYQTRCDRCGRETEDSGQYSHLFVCISCKKSVCNDCCYADHGNVCKHCEGKVNRDVGLCPVCGNEDVPLYTCNHCEKLFCEQCFHLQDELCWDCYHVIEGDG